MISFLWALWRFSLSQGQGIINTSGLYINWRTSTQHSLSPGPWDRLSGLQELSWISRQREKGNSKWSSEPHTQPEHHTAIRSKSRVEVVELKWHLVGCEAPLLRSGWGSHCPRPSRHSNGCCGEDIGCMRSCEVQAEVLAALATTHSCSDSCSR